MNALGDFSVQDIVTDMTIGISGWTVFLWISHHAGTVESVASKGSESQLPGLCSHAEPQFSVRVQAGQ